MDVRTAIVSGQFYPAGEASCRGEISEFLKGLQRRSDIGTVAAGIVPHAGWTFSGPTAAKVFSQIDRDHPPQTFVLFGAVHRWGVSGPSIYSSGAWETPLGELSIDEKLAQKILEASKGLIAAGSQAHSSEHSIEVQLPFLKYLFPEARIVPVAVPPDEKSHLVGQTIGKFLRDEKIPAVVIGTTDLTHYGPGYGFAPKGVGEDALRWAREVNDASVVRLALDMQADKIVSEAGRNHNACGSGAMAATVAAAAAMGAEKGILLEYTTSHDVMPMRRASDFVGYAGIVYGVKA